MIARLTAPLLLLALIWTGDSHAVQPDERLADPVLEARARDLSKGIRCLVCQNQSIDDSNADLARDLRILLRERLTAGDSDKQILDFLVARYGDFVLLKPPMKASTYALWFGPLAVFIGAVIGLVVFFRRRTALTAVQPGAAPLDSGERARLAALLDPEAIDGEPVNADKDRGGA
ncbi:MAG: cytochrome c-type biogenesis protein CcmH [Rhodospirillaceae bacterium]|jgi:cytochrome c-type biogenesis protein CcmH|nr:cytochrome c-type biogenesis protein CcmH [Rhodospirillaceae bacterium]MBT5665602.1 cytochrome c-type biogenesis protein CcmH [Rhodospirillaceae bacterium]MBT5809677.1 cytochrome c-type biogenesis protein CcmH [Rhodospirillaceae bacterium]